MRWLKQAIGRLTHPIRCKLNERIDELAFQASIRAIKETQWMTRHSAEDAADRAADRTISAVHQAFASYTPPTPWAEAWVDEVTQVLDSVIAEQFRLQSQVEELERLLREALADRVAVGGER